MSIKLLPLDDMSSARVHWPNKISESMSLLARRNVCALYILRTTQTSNIIVLQTSSLDSTDFKVDVATEAP